MMRCKCALLPLLLCACGLNFAQSGSSPQIGNCPVFPANNIWNARVDALQLHPSSAAYIGSIGTSGGIRYDMDLPITLVPGTQPKVQITFNSAEESDPGPYPIPPSPRIEGGSDHHVLIVDTDNCVLYEIYDAEKQADGTWTGGAGAVWSLRSNALRTAWNTSADGAGLAIVPGLLRYDEVVSGVINHALRFTAPNTINQFIWPARHRASFSTNPAYPPMGTRLRLKASFDISGYTTPVKGILRAMQQYGLMLADVGLPWRIQGDQDTRWASLDLSPLLSVPGSQFEVVDTSPMILDINSGQVLSSPPVAPTFSSLSPSTGSGTSATFTSTFQDTNGAVNVLSSYLVVTGSTADSSGSLNPASACYLWYNGMVNEFKLLGDDGSTWSSPANPGTAVVLQNSQCSFDASGASVTRNGTTFVTAVPLTFKAAFMGSRKNVYVSALGANGLGGAWVLGGDWLPTAATGARYLGGIVNAVASAAAYSRVTLYYTSTLKLTNISSAAVSGPFQVLFTGLSSGVTLAGANGTWSGSPYLTVPGVSSLAAGASVSVSLRFNAPANARIAFTPVVYSGSF